MIFLRNINTDDSNILAEIHKACFDSCWDKQSFQNMLIDPAFFGFIVGKEETNNEKINCGFILCRRTLDEIDIITFCVLPQHRRFGFGKLLIVETVKKAGMILKDESDILEIIKIFLEVAENNIPAINLSKTFGFNKVSKRPKYYTEKNGSAIDAYVMVLTIND